MRDAGKKLGLKKIYVLRLQNTPRVVVFHINRLILSRSIARTSSCDGVNDHEKVSRSNDSANCDGQCGRLQLYARPRRHWRTGMHAGAAMCANHELQRLRTNHNVWRRNHGRTLHGFADASRYDCHSRTCKLHAYQLDRAPTSPVDRHGPRGRPQLSTTVRRKSPSPS